MNEQMADSPVYTATLEQCVDATRTVMTPDRAVLWSSGDQLAIFQKSDVADVFQVTDATAGTSSGSFVQIPPDNETGQAIADNVAFYPYSDALTCVDVTENSDAAYEIGNVFLPSTQIYASESFPEGAYPMVAVSSDFRLEFKNILGVFKLQLKGTEKVKSVRLEGKNGERLSGAATVTAYNGKTPVVSMSDDASTSVTLDCGDGVQLSENEATSFMLALPPVLFTKGFKVYVEIVDESVKILETSVATNEILRSTILAMPVVDLSGPESMTHVELIESAADIANPERGFYEARGSSYKITQSSIEAARLQARTLFHIGYYLTDYMSSDIADSFLSDIGADMQLLRDNGAKCIIRFAYKNSAAEEDKPWDATPEWVQRHIEQLKPVLQEYGDVIMCFQAGFVGVWGEWYYTDNFVFSPDTPQEHELRKKVVDAMLDALPSDRQVALRTPAIKRMMYAESYADTLTYATAYDGSDKARLAAFNDCFGASSSDSGTFGGEETREFWKRDTRYVLMGGETCAVSDYCTCDASLKDMEDYHWTYLNSDYNADVISRWEADDCLDEIKRRLGYRLSLTDVYHSAEPACGQDYRVVLKIRNSGFAAPMNPRDVELVLVDGNGSRTVYECNDIDPRYWFAGQTVTIDKTVTIPESAIGACVLYLNLPDPKTTLHDNPLFSIRLANDGIWNEEYGYNELARFTLPERISGEDITYGEEFNPWG